MREESYSPNKELKPGRGRIRTKKLGATKTPKYIINGLDNIFWVYIDKSGCT